MGRACSTFERNAYKIGFGEPEMKRPHQRPMHKGEDNIRMDLKEIWLEYVN
jgi:hypothetical protein